MKSSRTFYCRVAASVGSISSILLEHPVQSPPVLAVLAVSYWNTLYSPTSVGSTSSICVSYLNGALVRPTGAAHCTTDHTDGNDAAVMDPTQPPDLALNKVICCSIHSLVHYHLGWLLVRYWLRLLRRVRQEVGADQSIYTNPDWSDVWPPVSWGDICWYKKPG